jgi:hypothetical protein
MSRSANILLLVIIVAGFVVNLVAYFLAAYWWNLAVLPLAAADITASVLRLTRTP